MYWMWAFARMSGGRAFRCCNRSVFSGRMTGGRSGDIDMFSFMLAVFRCRAFISHLFRWDRSTKHSMMPASAFLLSRWHAEKCVSAASRIRSLSFASVMHFVRVVWSSSPSAPFSPWINSDHLRRWTSRSIVYDARLVVTVATCAARAGRLVLSTVSTRIDTSAAALSSSNTLACIADTFARVSSISSCSPISR